jgi:hypothetical protein
VLCVVIDGISPRSALPGPGEERLRLFDNLPDHNPARELKSGRGFPYLNRPQPIEKARFEKINASKR